MAPTYIANAVLVIGMALQLLGIHVGDDALQTTIVTLLAIGVPIFSMVRQLITKKSTLAGTRPKQ